MDLHLIALSLVASGKGILAADESTETIKKRFDKICVESTVGTRRDYRELLFTTPCVNEYISGVILYDETIRQVTRGGVSFVEVLKNQGIIPGIKVDAGTVSMTSSPNEKITEGLDGLRERLREYFKLGAQFTKWRAVILIGDGIPTDECIQKNAERLAAYAKMCQEEGLVPIVEPEVLMDGDHSIERCFEVTKKVLNKVFAELNSHSVDLSGMLLKPNMVIAGEKAVIKNTSIEIAEMTVRCLKEAVPKEVPGVVFLSGGQSEQEACETLNAVNGLATDAPWQMSFSYGRALQASALAAWGGKTENVMRAQAAFAKQCRLVSSARQGKYSKIKAK